MCLSVQCQSEHDRDQLLWGLQDDEQAGATAANPASNGRMHRKVTEAALHTQLTHYRRLLDCQGALWRAFPGPSPGSHSATPADLGEKRAAGAGHLDGLKPTLQPACAAMQRLLDCSRHGWVSLSGLLAGLSTA